MYDVPILFLTFNRLDTAKQVLEVIREIKPSRFYLASDGPREEKKGEDKEIEIIREYLLEYIDWECDVKTLFRDRNLGCRKAVTEAINWFFEWEEEGIILEDDCVPDLTFFPYIEELLKRYRHDNRVMAVCGNNFENSSIEAQYSYVFSRYSLMWGWATWRRAWKLNDQGMSDWPRLRETNWLRNLGIGGAAFSARWTTIFDEIHSGKLKTTWDYQWIYSCWREHGLTILPEKNLVKNIGSGPDADATHTSGDRHFSTRLVLNSMSFPLRHPHQMEVSYATDRMLSKEWFYVNSIAIVRHIILTNSILRGMNTLRKSLLVSQQ